jgi:aryl-alcohol dehydrogenase-like predicted oxidoreductase
MALLAYSSQAHGFFTKLDRSSNISEGDILLFDNEINLKRLNRIRELAKRYQVEINDIVLAYLVSQPFPTIPIVGCRRVEQIHSSVRAVELTFTADELAYLENG